jgi:hypothetical protein
MNAYVHTRKHSHFELYLQQHQEFVLNFIYLCFVIFKIFDDYYHIKLRITLTVHARKQMSAFLTKNLGTVKYCSGFHL